LLIIRAIHVAAISITTTTTTAASNEFHFMVFGSLSFRHTHTPQVGRQQPATMNLVLVQARSKCADSKKMPSTLARVGSSRSSKRLGSWSYWRTERHGENPER
jgi:hypothetical protein